MVNALLRGGGSFGAASSPLRWLVIPAAAATYALLSGVPTGVVANPFYIRMTAECSPA